VSQSFGYIPKSGIAGSNGRSMFSFLSSQGESLSEEHYLCLPLKEACDRPCLPEHGKLRR
jgi:hypothetical protein